MPVSVLVVGDQPLGLPFWGALDVELDNGKTVNVGVETKVDSNASRQQLA